MREKERLRKIEEKYGMSWERFYYYAEVVNYWEPPLKRATPEEILNDLAELFEIDEEPKNERVRTC
ncbi:hypothetical protein [Thermococcus sp.]|uniref:hypothetical protein n=1 Tax=Thermococcus sp. TaxID=35749 RepID=UPI002638C477|nr:hypothetical protein [Thermococcus sp.]